MYVRAVTAGFYILTEKWRAQRKSVRIPGIEKRGGAGMIQSLFTAAPVTEQSAQDVLESAGDVAVEATQEVNQFVKFFSGEYTWFSSFWDQGAVGACILFYRKGSYPRNPKICKTFYAEGECRYGSDAVCRFPFEVWSVRTF